MRAMIVFLVLLAGCGSVKDSPTIVSDGLTDSGLPAVGELDRMAAEAPPTIDALGMVFATSPDAVRKQDPTYMSWYYELRGNDSECSWVIASWGPEWNGLELGVYPSGFDYIDAVQFPNVQNPQGWYGVADFAAGVWRWQQPGSGIDRVRYLDDVIQPLSPDGKVYFAVVVRGVGMNATPPEAPWIIFYP